MAASPHSPSSSSPPSPSSPPLKKRRGPPLGPRGSKRACTSCHSVKAGCVLPGGQPPCERCARMGRQATCRVPTERRKNKRRTGIRIEAARLVFGDALAQAQAHDLGNTPPTSSENALRRSALQSSLLLSLITAASLGGLRLAVGASSSVSPQFSGAIDDFLLLFSGPAQHDPSSPLLGRYGALRTALYVAVGAFSSSHSAILGPLAREMPPQGEARKRADLSGFGAARQGALDSLWGKVWEAAHEARVYEDPRREAWLLLLGMYQHAPASQATGKMAAQRMAVAMFWRVGDWLSGGMGEGGRQEAFEILLAKDGHRGLVEHRLPLFSDQEIALMLDAPSLPAKHFLSWHGPPPAAQSWPDLMQAIWATGLAIERLVCIAAAASLPLRPPEQAAAVLRSALQAYEDRQRWRGTTYTVTQDGVRMTAFGEPEDEILGDDDLERQSESLYALYRLSHEQAVREDALEEMEDMNARLEDMVDEMVGLTLVGVEDDFDDTNPGSRNRDRVEKFAFLPGGAGWLSRWLQRASSPADFRARSQRVESAWMYLRQLSFEGGNCLMLLRQLEAGLNALSDGQAAAKAPATPAPAQAAVASPPPKAATRRKPLRPTERRKVRDPPTPAPSSSTSHGASPPSKLSSSPPEMVDAASVFGVQLPPSPASTVAAPHFHFPSSSPPDVLWEAFNPEVASAIVQNALREIAPPSRSSSSALAYV